MVHPTIKGYILRRKSKHISLCSCELQVIFSKELTHRFQLSTQVQSFIPLSFQCLHKTFQVNFFTVFRLLGLQSSLNRSPNTRKREDAEVSHRFSQALKSKDPYLSHSLQCLQKTSHVNFITEFRLLGLETSLYRSLNTREKIQGCHTQNNYQ